MEDLTKVQRELLDALKDLTVKKPSCIISHKRLGKMLGYAPRTIYRNLMILEDLQLISIRNRRNRDNGSLPNEYTLIATHW